MYNQQPHDQMSLCDTMNAGCLDMTGMDQTHYFAGGLEESVMLMTTCGQMLNTGLTNTVVFLCL